ncbi:hypothetical protein K1719_029742 [Acacia pycnantha]|nr:hypothetical protein K1719_029742 [Acacia pycnantha]
MYEAPRIHDRLSRTFIRTRTLVNIKKPLVVGFWVPRPQRKPVWVSIRYERLQNYCYDCGRIGHEAKNCKSQHEGMIDEEAEAIWGNSLGTVHVRTREDSVVIHHKAWDEVHLFIGKSTPAAEKAPQRKSIGGQNISGRAKDLGDISAAQSLGRYETKDGQREGINENYMQVQRGIIMTELISLNKEISADLASSLDPSSSPKLLLPNNPAINDINQGKSVTGSCVDQGGKEALSVITTDKKSAFKCIIMTSNPVG